MANTNVILIMIADIKKLLHDEKYPEGIDKNEADCFFKCFMVGMGSVSLSLHNFDY